MGRALVVKGETAASVADAEDAGLEGAPCGRRTPRSTFFWPSERATFAVRGPKRVLDERVLDIRVQQLEVLLLVVESQFDHGTQPLQVGRRKPRQALGDGRIDVGPIAEHLTRRGPSQ